MRSPYRAPVRAASALIAVTVLASGCSIKPRDTLSAADVAHRTASRLAGTFHIPAPPVTCPKSVPARPGATFTCTAGIDGQALAIRGTVTGGHGQVRLHPEAAVISTPRAEAAITRHLQGQFGQTVRLACQAPALLVAAPERSFRCTAQVGRTSRQITVRFAGTTGALSYRVLPYKRP